MDSRRWDEEVGAGQRFRFGENWSRFLEVLDDERITSAERSLKGMLGVHNLEGRSFVDVGSGSGLFSLAARRLGAAVTSFDYDPQSVACTVELKRRYFTDDEQWIVQQGSVLDIQYLKNLGEFDIVYSWGVLHHTGEMWRALENASILVSRTGKLFIAVYNDQGRASQIWKSIKRSYVGASRVGKFAVLSIAFARLWGPSLIRDMLKGKPTSSWKNYSRWGGRGMDPWRDVVDWVGGYPFEVARPEDVLDFCLQRGFRLERMKTCGGGLGCNEYVFVRVSTASHG